MDYAHYDNIRAVNLVDDNIRQTTNTKFARPRPAPRPPKLRKRLKQLDAGQDRLDNAGRNAPSAILSDPRINVFKISLRPLGEADHVWP